MLTATTFLSLQNAARPAAFDLPDLDAFAIGRGMAVVATADNPSAIYYNPAGLTQLQGHNLRGGVYGLHLGTEYDSPAGGSFDNEEPWHAIPQLFYAYKLESLPLSFGAGIYTPFGLSMKWPQDTGFRTIATEGSLTYLTINPVMAWEIVPGLSVGGGVTLNYSEVDLRQGFTTFPDNDEFRIHGDGTDLGFNLGLLWKISPKVSTGISYRSGTKIDMDGHTHTSMVAPTPFALSSDASADFPFPQKVVVGISYRPTPAWNLEFDVDWTDWDRLDMITVNQATPAPGFPADVPLQLHWQSSCYYEFGVTRYFENDWLVSFGYIFNENSMPDAYYNPIVADLDRHFLSIGAGRRGAHLDFDISYQFGYGPKRTVTGSATSPAGQTADGDYEFISHAVGITVGWRF